MSIFQDLVDSHGFSGKCSSVKRFVRKLCGSMPLETSLMSSTTIGENRLVRRLMARHSAFNWMRKVLQGEFTPTLLCSEIGRQVTGGEVPASYSPARTLTIGPTHPGILKCRGDGERVG